MINRSSPIMVVVLVLSLGSACTDQPTSPPADAPDATLDVTAASGDVVVIPPTPVSSDPDQQLLNSIATLDAFQKAIDDAPAGGRTIQLQAGVYDFRAVVILEPDDPANPRENYSIGRGGAHWYNPHELDAMDFILGGIAILGKQNLTIEGVPGTTIRGNSDPDALCRLRELGSVHNVLFTVAADFDTPSGSITFRNLNLENFTQGILAFSRWTSIPRLDPRLGVGTEDLLIENNWFKLGGTHAVAVVGQHVRPTVQNNTFEGIGRPSPCDFSNDGGVIVMVAPLKPLLPEAPELTGARIIGNTFRDSWQGVRVARPTEAMVTDNIFDIQPGGVANPFGVVRTAILHPGTGGLVDPSPPVIEGNRINGGFSGITLFGTNGWTVRNNEVHGATFGSWLEWGAFAPTGPPFTKIPELRRLWMIEASANKVQNNHLTGNTVGVFVGAFARNNEFKGNNVTESEFAGYFIRGPEEFFPGLLRIGPASGNTVVGGTLTGAESSVIDASGCFPGPEGCPQLDDDRDGRTNEDPIDLANNDGDAVDLFGLSLSRLDEDPAEEPNFITGLQAVHGPSRPPWADPQDTDDDGLSDVLELKLSAFEEVCLDTKSADSDGDGITDGDEFLAGTLDSCIGF